MPAVVRPLVESQRLTCSDSRSSNRRRGMASDERVQAALGLLQEAGRLDLVRNAVLGPLWPAWREGWRWPSWPDRPHCVHAVKQSVSLKGGAEGIWDRLWGRGGEVIYLPAPRASPRCQGHGDQGIGPKGPAWRPLE
ncbi:hypothetical protein NDU88_003063 [Pleurodeles waltl]|uniref:Uncharacterized protein n=1 Tax=Pleurodeles waltl TaxID=8319 RepID=A0AAV7LLX5_PLEWA|nr:hypothetical protein NDU88_003063 [Pleurodeles waltl]